MKRTIFYRFFVFRLTFLEVSGENSSVIFLLTQSLFSPRPCQPRRGEGFVSSGASITLELRLEESTSLRPVRFAALYEFVDPRQDGEHMGPGPCDRRFTSRSRAGPASAGLVPFRDLRDNSFRSPRDIFLYGRGGAKNLRYKFYLILWCVITF